MKIRSATENDIGNIQALIFRNIDEVMLIVHSKNALEKVKLHTTFDVLLSQLTWKMVFVVEDENQIIATGSFANFGTNNQPKYSVSNLFVKPELHKNGIGTMLIEHLISIAKEKNAVVIHVPASRTGIAFYKKMGFETDNEQPEEIDEIIWMTKNLNNNVLH